MNNIDKNKIIKLLSCGVEIYWSEFNNAIIKVNITYMWFQGRIYLYKKEEKLNKMTYSQNFSMRTLHTHKLYIY